MTTNDPYRGVAADEPPAELCAYEYDVFISYSHKNYDWVHHSLLPVLQKEGIKYCIDEEHFKLGHKSIQEMNRCVKNSRKMICVFTPDYIRSEFCDFEAVTAKSLDPAAKQAKIIPLFLEECEIPLILSNLVGIDFTKGKDEGVLFGKLIRTLLETPADENVNTSKFSHIIKNNEIPRFIPHPYPEAPNFTGRKKERTMLTGWLVKDKGHPILSLTAIGGMGKSSLSWRWLQEDVIGNGLDIDGVIWWSFYESHANFSAFINEVISYLFPEKEEVMENKSDREKIYRVLREFQHRRFLIVFDGFERSLRAYMSNSPSPDMESSLQFREDRHRQCTDPDLSWFLRSISSSDCQSKTLLITRLHPLDLEGLSGVRKYSLERMNSQDAVDFFHALGIRGSAAEIKHACEKFDYLPLCLRLLSGILISHPKFRKDKDIKHAKVIPDLDFTNVGTQYHDAVKFENILNYSYDNLSDEDQQLISCISAFRSPMGFEMLVDILHPEMDKYAFSRTLQSLYKRGLLLYDEDADRYDLHPVVRRYCYRALTNPRQIHDLYARYFQKLVDYTSDDMDPHIGKKYATVDSVDELQPVIELYYHTVRAGRYDEAADLFIYALQNPLIYQFYQTHLVIELLETLFGEGLDQPKISDEKKLALIYRILAVPYIQQNVYQAMELQNRSCKLFEKIGDFNTYARTLHNLSSSYLLIGDLQSALESLHQGIDLIMEKSGRGYENILRNASVRILAYLGQFDESHSTYEMAKNFWLKNTDYRHRTMLSYFRSLSSILSGDFTDAIHFADEALLSAELQAKMYNPVMMDEIYINWLKGKSFLNLGDLRTAESFLQKAIVESRKTHFVSVEGSALIDLARLLHSKGMDTQSLALVQEALEIAKRYYNVIQQTHAYLFLAEYWKDNGDMVKARENAELAKLRSHQMIASESGELSTKDPDTRWKNVPAFNRAVELLEELDAEK